MWIAENTTRRENATRQPAVTTVTPRPRVTPVVSVVLPVFNEWAALPVLVDQLKTVLLATCDEAELVFVDDGCTDGSGHWLDQLALPDLHVVVVHLSRNFGHQAALQAGLEAATGDVVVIMDSDLQDDPRAIPQFLEQWFNGYDVVYAVRTQRKESWFKRLLFAGFYRTLNTVAEITQPVDAGNFGLLDRAVVQQLLSLPERERYFPGLRAWVGYHQTGVSVERLARHDGTPRVSLWGLCRLARTAIWSFSRAPLQVLAGIAAISVSSAAVVWVVCLWSACLSGTWTAPHFAAAVTLTFFALNACGLMILGEYLARILDQVRGRPAYCVAEIRRTRPQTVQTDPMSRRLRVVGANSLEQLAPRVYHRD